jgi:hypothetical protein
MKHIRMLTAVAALGLIGSMAGMAAARTAGAAITARTTATARTAASTSAAAARTAAASKAAARTAAVTAAARTAAVRAAISVTLKAPAGDPQTECSYGALCAWTGADYTGTIGQVYQDNKTLPATPWHSAESVYNNGAPCSGIYTANVWIYKGADYNSEGGHFAELHPQTGFAYMKTQLPGLYHHVYSNYWCDAAPS